VLTYVGVSKAEVVAVGTGVFVEDSLVLVASAGVAVALLVSDGTAVDVSLAVAVALGVLDGTGVSVSDSVGVAVGVSVETGVAVLVGVFVAGAVAVLVAVHVAQVAAVFTVTMSESICQSAPGWGVNRLTSTVTFAGSGPLFTEKLSTSPPPARNVTVCTSVPFTRTSA
jgi:hypothetical protein